MFLESNSVATFKIKSSAIDHYSFFIVLDCPPFIVLVAHVTSGFFSNLPTHFGRVPFVKNLGFKSL